jgi:hypothetical protein
VTAPLQVARLSGWLVRERKAPPAGRWVVRCPNCITTQARRLVGLPGRGSILRVSRLIDRTLTIELDGYIWAAWRNAAGRFVLQSFNGRDGTVQVFDTIAALCLAMSAVADLRKWRL